MKTINFNRKTSMLRSMDEVKQPKKKINWDKIVYFVILFFIIFFLLRYFIIGAIYTDAPGHVLFKSLKIRVPQDITIKTFNFGEGDTVAEGDTIFSYIPAKEENDFLGLANFSSTSNNNDPSWIEREVYQLNKNIAIKRIEISENTELISWYKEQIKILETEVILEITPKSKIDNYQKEIEKLTLEIESATKQINIYYQLSANLKSRSYQPDQSSLTTEVASLGSGGLQIYYYIAPISGTITRLYKNNYEVALKSEVILNIHKREKIYIKAFFTQESLRYVNEGDEVSVLFPDGSSSVGHIKRFYFATYRMPEEFQKKYESTTRAIAADIYPIENEDEIKWKAFYKMAVTLRINKF